MHTLKSAIRKALDALSCEGEYEHMSRRSSGEQIDAAFAILTAALQDRAPRRIGIVIEGGSVQSVFTDCADLAGVTAYIVDYDTEGTSPDPEDDAQTTIQQADGARIRAFASALAVEAAGSEKFADIAGPRRPWATGRDG